MKTLEIERTVVVKEVKYEACDGKVFENKLDCEKYEKKLEALKFKYDRSKATGKLTKSNWKHYIYRYYEEFGSFGYKPKADYIKERTYRKRENGKLQKFRLRDVKEEFIKKFFDPHGGFEYREDYSDRHEGFDSRLPSKNDVDHMLKAYRFFIESGLITFEDIIPLYDVSSYELREGQEQITREKRIYYLSSAIIRDCILHDSIEAFDIVYDNFGLDLASAMSQVDSGNNSTTSTLRLKRDFVSQIIFGEFDNHYSVNWDDDKKIKWINHLLVEKDVPVKMYSFASMRAKLSGKKTLYSGVKDEDVYLMRPSIEDIIKDIDNFCRHNYSVFIFQKNVDKVISILNSAGPRFKKANKDNKMPSMYYLVDQAFDIVKEVFSEHPEYNMEYNTGQRFSIKKYKESKKEKAVKTSYNHMESHSSIQVNFYLDCLGRLYERKFDMVAIEDYTPSRYGHESKSEVIMKNDLNNYKTPSDLATDIIYHISGGKLITTNKNINQIELKLKEIRDKKAEILKQEAELMKEKDMVSKIKKK